MAYARENNYRIISVLITALPPHELVCSLDGTNGSVIKTLLDHNSDIRLMLYSGSHVIFSNYGGVDYLLISMVDTTNKDELDNNRMYRSNHVSKFIYSKFLYEIIKSYNTRVHA